MTTNVQGKSLMNTRVTEDREKKMKVNLFNLICFLIKGAGSTIWWAYQVETQFNTVANESLFRNWNFGFEEILRQSKIHFVELVAENGLHHII